MRAIYDKMLPRVSIIIPYNVDRGWLNEAIESVHTQTYLGEIELILCKSKKNVSANINDGIRAASGEYVKYLCEDDTLTPNCIHDSVMLIEGYDFLHGNAYNVFPTHKQEQRPVKCWPTFADMITNNVIHGGTLMYRRDVFDRVGLFNEQINCAEEYEFNLRCLRSGMRIAYCDKFLYNYRRHDKQKSLGQSVDQTERAKRIQAIKDSVRMKVVIGMATMPGREKQCEAAINSLRNQCDQIFLYDNGTNKDLTDLGKFYGLSKLDEPVYFLTCDDDLIYPPDYVQRTTGNIDKYKCIVTYHGRQLKGRGLPYYTGHKSFAFNKENKMDIPIHIAGTGVCGFRTDQFNPVGIHKRSEKRMSDLVFSHEAAKQGVKIMLCSHLAGWIRQQQVDERTAIHTTERNNTELTRLADKIMDEHGIKTT